MEGASDHAPVWISLRDEPDYRRAPHRQATGPRVAPTTTASPKKLLSTHRTGDGKARKARAASAHKPQMGAFGVTAFGFADGINIAEMRKTAQAARAKGRVGLILVETPANPTNGLVDLAACAAIADELAKSQGYRPPVAVDNTMLGPMFQTPLKCGAGISLCSLTKYVGGHSDLVGGSISGDANLVKQVMSWRSSIGTQLDPNSCWMLMRSLETLEIRMTRSNANGCLVAEYLAGHPKIARVLYLGLLKERDPRKTVFDRQCSAPGSTFAFDVKGGEKEAFALLDHLQVMKLAVSLGGTETLISHPASMTHSGVARELREEIGSADPRLDRHRECGGLDFRSRARPRSV
jgi:methionine-gamma-lyase